MLQENRDVLVQHHVVHISALKSIVFERIMINGKPAFFPTEEGVFEGFQKLWNERDPIFKSIAKTTIQNDGSVEISVENVLKQLPLHILV